MGAYYYCGLMRDSSVYAQRHHATGAGALSPAKKLYDIYDAGAGRAVPIFADITLLSSRAENTLIRRATSQD